MASLDIASLLLFSLIVFVAGMSFARSGSGMKSFFAAGGAVPWWISGLSLFMSFFSVGTFVVWGSIAYRSGLVAVAIQTTMCLAGIVVGLWFAPRWNAAGTLTVAEYISLRLGPQYQYGYSVLFLVISLFTAGAFLYPVGKIVEVSTGVPIEACILVLGGLVIAYTASGGLWAVLVTDVLQFVVLSAAVITLVPVSLAAAGGFAAFVDSAPAGFFNLTNAEYTLTFLIGFCIYNAVFIGGNWAYVQRYTSVRAPGDARKVGLLFAGLYAIAPVIWMLPPMLYRIIQPDAATVDDEGAYLLVAREVLPNGLLGLMLGGMVFATASSVNTTLNISAGVFTNDILKGAGNARRQMAAARISTVIFGLFAVTVALLVEAMGGIVSVVLGLAAITGAAIFLPPIWSLFSAYQTGLSIFSTTLATLAINLFAKFALPALSGVSLSRGAEMILGVCLPIVLLALFEWKYRLRGSPAARFAGYEKARRRRSEAKANAPAPSNSTGARAIAWGALATGALIVVIGLLSSAYAGLVAALGSVIALTSALAIFSLPTSATDPGVRNR